MHTTQTLDMSTTPDKKSGGSAFFSPTPHYPLIVATGGGTHAPGFGGNAAGSVFLL